MDELKNSFECKVSWPKRLIFRDIMYIDDADKNSIFLRDKYGIRYFKCRNVLYHPDYSGIRIVLGSVLTTEARKWRALLKNLMSINEDNTAYNEVCTNLRTMLDEYVSEKERRNAQ